MKPTAKSRTVDLHAAAQLQRKERGKPEVNFTQVKSVPPATFLSLAVSQEVVSWVKTIAFPKGSGNQAPHVFPSNGMTRELQRVSRDRKKKIVFENALAGRSENETLCRIVDWLTQCGVGNCADNVQAAAVKFSSLLENLPRGVELHLVGHPLMDHAQLWIIPSKGAIPIIVDPWLVIPIIHLKSNENRAFRFHVDDYPLSTSGFHGDKPYTRVTRSIRQYDPVFKKTVEAIERRDGPDETLEEIIRANPARTPSVQTHAGPSGIYDGNNWAVRRSRKVIFENNETREQLDLYQYDLDTYFDQRLKILLVDHLGLLTQKSDLAEFPYRGGAAFTSVLDALEGGNAKLIANLLTGLPESTASKLLGELLVLGVPQEKQAAAICSLSDYALADSDTRVLRMVLDTVLLRSGAHIELLSKVVDRIAHHAQEEGVVSSRVADCLGTLPKLEKELVRSCAMRHGSLHVWVNAESNLDLDAALLTAAKDGHIGGIRLLSNSTSPNGSESSERPIHAAARYGHALAVHALIKAGAELDYVDSDGLTILHRASSLGQNHLVEILLDAGADPNVKSRSGKTPWMLSCTIKSLGHFACCDDVDWSLTDNDGDTIWHQVMRDGGGRDLALALAKFENKNVRTPNREGHSALTAAVNSGEHEVIAALVTNAFVDVNQQGPGGETALMLACAYLDREAVDLLLTHPHLNLQTVDRSGRTAYDFCLNSTTSNNTEQNQRYLDLAEILNDATARKE
jgi:ankyrin repeat protein